MNFQYALSARQTAAKFITFSRLTIIYEEYFILPGKLLNWSSGASPI